MPSYTEEKRRRIEQFAQCLRLMNLRRQKVVKHDCFIIFDEAPPEDAGSPKLKESVAIKADCIADGGSPSGRLGDFKGLLKPGKSRKRRSRYLQFAFRRDCFYLELPNNTVFPQEAQQIFQYRLGFYWAKNRPDLRWVRANWEDILTWEPLQKIYLYRDEESAAEDMAFILFQVWKFPVDSPLYIKAASFHTDHHFEHGKQLD
ncbi:MAG: hypothetical protein WCJ35_10985 [Planctomycetota bacterium]